MLYITQNTVRNKPMYINNNNYVKTKPVKWPNAPCKSNVFICVLSQLWFFCYSVMTRPNEAPSFVCMVYLCCSNKPLLVFFFLPLGLKLIVKKCIVPD